MLLTLAEVRLTAAATGFLGVIAIVLMPFADKLLGTLS